MAHWLGLHYLDPAIATSSRGLAKPRWGIVSERGWPRRPRDVFQGYKGIIGCLSFNFDKPRGISRV